MFQIPSRLRHLDQSRLPRPDLDVAVQPFPQEVVVRIVDHLEVGKPLVAQLSQQGNEAPRWAPLLNESNETEEELDAQQPAAGDTEALARKEMRATKFAKPFGRYVAQDVVGTLAYLVYVRTPPDRLRPNPGAICVLKNCEMRRGIVVVGEDGKVVVEEQTEMPSRAQLVQRLEAEKQRLEAENAT